MDVFLTFAYYIIEHVFVFVVDERIQCLRMNIEMKTAFIGGDARQHTAAVKLADLGRFVTFFGGDFEKCERIRYFSSLDEAINDAQIVILPLPASVDGSNLNAPFFSGGQIKLAYIIDRLKDGVLLIGGRIPEKTLEEASKKGIRVIDYFVSEEFQIKNAYTTAEAALCIAMNNLKKNIKDSRFAITGYGRIAKCLSNLLLKLDANVCVLARKESDLAWARLSGARTQKLDLKAIDSLESGYDVIFNTVPAWLFGENFLIQMSKKTQIIDLASSPGGVDISAAKKIGANVVWASSLPGKYAPESAGDLIFDCIKGIIEGVEK